MSNIIQTDNYQSQFELLSEDYLKLFQRRTTPTYQVTTEVWGDVWSFAIADLQPNLVGVRHGKNIIPLEGRVGLYFPRRAIIEWHLYPGFFDFRCILSGRQLPPGMPNKAVAFDYPEQLIPESPKELAHIVSHATNFIEVEHAPDPHPIALTAKSILDANFTSECSIGVIAQRLKTSEAVLSRAFKASYGIPPVAYRNCLRVTESMRKLLTSSKSVSDICYQSGFQDLSRFNKQFKKQVKARPTQYRLSR